MIIIIKQHKIDTKLKQQKNMLIFVNYVNLLGNI